MLPKTGLGGSKGTDKPGTGNSDSKKAASATAWDLTIGNGQAIHLDKKVALTESDVTGGGGKGSYLRVAMDGGSLTVINDSQDTWEVVSLPGKKRHKIAHGQSIVLKDGGDTITFRKGIEGTILPRADAKAAAGDSATIPEHAP